MRRGSVLQRHTRACPREESGELADHRCRGPWKFIVDFGRTSEGKRRQLVRSGFSTRREAQAALEVELSRQQAGIRTDSRLTVEMYFEQWLSGKRNLRPTTLTSYRYLIKNYLIPALGWMLLQDLRADHIDALYNELLANRGPRRKTTASVVQHVHRVLRSALNTAVKRRLIQWNPATQVELPQHRPARSTIWRPNDLAAFLDVATTHRLYAMFHLIAFTGMRRGEALGLHWSDIDLEQAELRVTWQVTDAGQGPALGEPKTTAGFRVVPLDAETVAVLRRHREQQQAEHASWGPAAAAHDLAFTRDNGKMLRPDFVTHLFGRLVAEAGVERIRLHDLRHTHASLALAAGIDIKVVSDRLGHSTTNITSNLYTHVVPEVARDAADAIAAAVAYTRRVKTTDVAAAWPQEAEGGEERSPPQQ